jgi:pimeloyl-ACP methyl ester carboxylesterase
MFLHGIFGRGSNLRTLARRFLQHRPHWDAILVDLRGHGSSPKGSPTPTIEAAAADVQRLWTGSPPAVVVGHSFGGKVALALAGTGVSHVVTLDSNPGPVIPSTEPNSPSAVLAVLRTLPDELPNRTAFIHALTASGLSLLIAQWLAMSTEPTPTGGIRFALDRDEMAALLASYQTTDLWSVLAAPPEGLSVHVVIAERSTAYSEADRRRVHELMWPPRVTVDYLPTSHWIPTEDPDGVQRVLEMQLPP